MKRTGFLKRYTRLNLKRSTPRTHKFTVRLTGTAMLRLRRDCWLRDGGYCQECKVFTSYFARWEGDPHAYDMAHIKSRGAGGSDVLENVRTLCHECHMAEHVKGRM